MFAMVIPGLKTFYTILQPAKAIRKIFMWHEKKHDFFTWCEKNSSVLHSLETLYKGLLVSGLWSCQFTGMVL